MTINIKSWQSPDPFVVGIGPEPVVLRVGSLNTPISRRIRNYMGPTEIPCAIYLPCLAKHQGLATPPHILTFAMVLILDGYSEHVPPNQNIRILQTWSDKAAFRQVEEMVQLRDELRDCLHQLWSLRRTLHYTALFLSIAPNIRLQAGQFSTDLIKQGCTG